MHTRELASISHKVPLHAQPIVYPYITITSQPPYVHTRKSITGLCSCMYTSAAMLAVYEAYNRQHTYDMKTHKQMHTESSRPCAETNTSMSAKVVYEVQYHRHHFNTTIPPKSG